MIRDFLTAAVIVLTLLGITASIDPANKPPDTEQER